MSSLANNARTPVPQETGDLLAEYKTGSGQQIFLIIGLPFLFALFIGSWVYTVTKWNVDLISLGFILFTVIALGPGGFFLISWIFALSALRWRLHLFRNGLLHRKGSSFRWIPWQDVSMCYEKHVIMSDISLGHCMYLYPRQGKKLLIELFKNSMQIAQDIKSCLVPVLVRQAEEELGNNQAIDFRVVKLSKSGLQKPSEDILGILWKDVFRFVKLKLSKSGLQKPSEVILWEDVETLAIEDNKGIDYHVVVRVPGKKEPWLDVPVGAFPNLDVFIQLAEKMLDEPVYIKSHAKEPQKDRYRLQASSSLFMVKAHYFG